MFNGTEKMVSGVKRSFPWRRPWSKWDVALTAI